MFPYPDSHCHLPFPVENPFEGIWINSCREQDWETLFSTEYQRAYRFYGIHPWKDFSAQKGWEYRLEEYLHRDKYGAIGETGLDSGPRGKDRDIQLREFQLQLDLASNLNRPVSLHLFKAWEDLYRICGSLPDKIPIMIHGFLSSSEQAQQLIRHGFFLSLGPGILQKGREWLKDMLKKIPENRILVESDLSDPLSRGDYERRIESVYSALEQSSSREKEYWRSTIERNQSLFKNGTNGGQGGFEPPA